MTDVFENVASAAGDGPRDLIRPQGIRAACSEKTPPWPDPNITVLPREEEAILRIVRIGIPPPQGVAKTVKSSVRNRFDELTKLKDGWDSYSAPAPSVTAIENAKAFVQEANGLDVALEPSAMGGVGVTFSAAGREVVIEFYNKGNAHALFAHEVTGEMHTQVVSTNTEGYRRIIGEVRTYLHGE